MFDCYLMSRFLDMPLPENYEDRLWINKILDHMSYEEAFNQRHEIAFRPYKKDRTANIHNNWVYKVEWETFNGGRIETWEIEDHLVHLKELDIYKEVNLIIMNEISRKQRAVWAAFNSIHEATEEIREAVEPQSYRKYIENDFEHSRVVTRCRWTSSEDEKSEGYDSDKGTTTTTS